MVNRGCRQRMPDGRLCRAPALSDEPYCYMHHPDRALAAAESRRLGGLHRRREGTLAAVYGVEELGSIAGYQRLLQVAAYETLALDNSVARNRTLVAVVTAGAKLLETGELEERLAALEAVSASNREHVPDPLFPDDES